MIERLEILKARYDEINEELLQPEVLSDFNKQKKLVMICPFLVNMIIL